ncbi:glycoside hydrolase family 3 C-terminal domain-containing protein [Aspergillus undulatus]|uniref:glycoside hydrolase family 3 C-terminal domain-containing protein n=1 Tax=Aspergillus undulatus TaxID=1810928 RepID=UPI003CCE035E
MWPFQDAIHTGTGDVIVPITGSIIPTPAKIARSSNGALKEELRFQRFVVSDCGALHAGYDAALSGLDVVMPATESWASNLTQAVRNTSIPEASIDDMVIRTISAWYQAGQDHDFPMPDVGMPTTVAFPHEIIDARDPVAERRLLQGAVEGGHVLVKKNVNNALPLRKPRMLSILGYSAKAPDQQMPEANVHGYVPSNSTVSATQNAFNGILISGGGSGATSQSTIISPFQALLVWDFWSVHPSVMQVSDACLVFGNAYASENYDRSGLRDEYADTLILKVERRCTNTVVILHNADTRFVEPWIEKPNITAVILAHFPGEASGHALVSLLHGESQFSGPLLYTVAKQEPDHGDLLTPTRPSPTGRFRYFPQSNFSEGVYIDYRHFNREDIKPRFELDIRRLGVFRRNPYPFGPLLPGGPNDLRGVLARVTATISIIDAQLYLGIPGRPDVWDVPTQKWGIPTGICRVYVGSGSRDLPLSGTILL